jgi:carbohydrate-selective porin OprB
MRRIGILVSIGADDQQARHAAFVQRLRELGWTEGRNVRIEIFVSVGVCDRNSIILQHDSISLLIFG